MHVTRTMTKQRMTITQKLAILTFSTTVTDTFTHTMKTEGQ